MKTYIYNIKNNSIKPYSYNISDLYTDNSYTLEDLKTDINNGYANKFSWWDKLTKKSTPKKTYTYTPIILNSYDNEMLYKVFTENTNGYIPTLDDYDFELNGEPVKIYDNFIQVGYDIIPRNNSSYFMSLTPKKKKIIIDIITKITIK